MNSQDNYIVCDNCKGTGKVKIDCPARHHNHKITVKCGRCNGSGKIPK